MTSNDDTFTLFPDDISITDSVLLFITGGDRLGIAVKQFGSDDGTTYLTPDEWRTLRAEGDRLVALIEAKAGEQS